jgi:hypothetical protein
MDLGIGLPNAVPGSTGGQLTDWARAAEDAGFSTLGTIEPSSTALLAPTFIVLGIGNSAGNDTIQ